MCGLVGAAGNLNQKEKKMFRDMLVFDQVRGFDSTGVLMVDTNRAKGDRGCHVLKDLGAAQNLWEFDTYKELIDDRGTFKPAVKVLMGHNRAATIGAITMNSAHPFQYGEIVGAHNGTLRFWSNLEGGSGPDKFDVDSKALIKTIANKGVDHTWDNFQGAAAIQWWDKNLDTMNFIRNNERPLYYVFNKTGSAVFWASEAWMITIAATREGRNIQLERDKNNKIVVREFKANHYYCFHVKAADVELKEVRELEKKSYTPSHSTPYTPYQQQNGSGGTGSNVITANTGNAAQMQNGSMINVDDWKTFTNTKFTAGTEKLSGLNYKAFDIQGTEMRTVKRSGFGGPVPFEWVFRLPLRVSGTSNAVLDIYPQNKGEWKRLMIILKNINSGQDYNINFNANPRVRSQGKEGVCPSYVCNPSILSFKKIKKVEEDKPNVGSSDKIDETLYPYFSGTWVTLNTYKDLIKDAGNCCCWCSTSKDHTDVDTITWISQRELMCDECAEVYASNSYLMNMK